MTIDFWGLGLQALNVLILIWLLSRLFWRPVAAAIAKRQKEAIALLDSAKTADAKAEAARQEVNKARSGIAEERAAMLAEAATAAETATAATMATAREKADALIEVAKLANAREAQTAKKERLSQAANLSVDIAARLLARLDTAAVHAAFLDLLVEAIAAMPEKDRAALAGSQTAIDLVSATSLGAGEKAEVSNAIGKELGKTPDLNFVTDPGLIAGLELRTAHLQVHNSWQFDLASIRKDLGDAI